MISDLIAFIIIYLLVISEFRKITHFSLRNKNDYCLKSIFDMNLSFFDRFKKEKKHDQEERNSTFDYLLYNSGGNYTTSKALLLSTVYRCVEVISDSVAQLPLEPYKIDA